MNVDPTRASSPRRDELLERAYAYAIEHGLSDLSLRPLASAVGSSPRVLLFLFGSKDGLVRALLARARDDELAALEQVRSSGADEGLAGVVRTTWQWLAADGHRPLLTLWLEAYARSLTDPDGAWAGFGAKTVADWLALLAESQPPGHRHTNAGAAERTLALAVLRGALLDLLATGDVKRATAAVETHLSRAKQRAPGAPAR